MSKELDALKRFNSNVVVYNEYLYQRNLLDDELYQKNNVEINKDYDLLKQALKRNEPMKPKYEKDGTRSCPMCHANWLTPNFNYCPVCGQKLDWSDEK